MKKRFLSMLLALALALSLAPAALAAADAEAVLTAGGNITLTEDLKLDADVTITKDTVLDLNGHTLSSDPVEVPDSQYEQNPNLTWKTKQLNVAEGATVIIKNGKFENLEMNNSGNIKLLADLEIDNSHSMGIGNGGTGNIDRITRCTITAQSHAIICGGRIGLIDNCEATAERWTPVHGNYIERIYNCRFIGTDIWRGVGLGNRHQGDYIGSIENCVLIGYGRGGLVSYGGVENVSGCTIINTKKAENKHAVWICFTDNGLHNERFTDCTFIAQADQTGTDQELNQTGCTFLPLSSVNWRDYAVWEMEPAPAPSLENFAAVNTYTPGQFTDVAESHWGAANVRKAYELGLMLGNNDTVFDPDGSVTIAQAIALAARLHSVYGTGEEYFIEGDVWYQTYADYAKRSGIPADFADYSAAATRSQFAAILAAALPAEALEAINSVADDAVPDVKMTDESASAIYALYRAGIIVGNDDAGTFMPETSITRTAAAALVTRMADKSLRETITLE